MSSFAIAGHVVNCYNDCSIPEWEEGFSHFQHESLVQMTVINGELWYVYVDKWSCSSGKSSILTQVCELEETSIDAMQTKNVPKSEWMGGWSACFLQ